MGEHPYYQETEEKKKQYIKDTKIERLIIKKLCKLLSCTEEELIKTLYYIQK